MKPVNPRLPEINSQFIENAMRQFRDQERIDLLAGKTATSKAVLWDKLNPERTTHKLDIFLIASLTAFTGNTCLIEGLAKAVGLAVYKPEQVATGDNVVCMQFKRQCVEGAIAEKLARFLDDGVLDAHEADELIPHLEQASRQIMEQLAALNALVTASASIN